MSSVVQITKGETAVVASMKMQARITKMEFIVTETNGGGLKLSRLDEE